MDSKESKARVSKLKKYFYNEGYFSEYLPTEFCLGGIKDTYTKRSIGTVKPYAYTMSKFRGDSQRRVIQIPELVNYLAAVQSFDESILKKIVAVDAGSNSFSKLFSNNDNEIIRYSNPSDAPLNTLQEGMTIFSSNLTRKLIASKGAKGILYLDIANFFDSFYTHNITAIFSGERWAQEQYSLWVKSHQDTEVRAEYKALAKVDEKIRSMNLNRTHGLLTGPFVSKMIAETLMNRVDKELETLKLSFVRFMDDYEVFIFDDKEVDPTIKKIQEVLYNYGFGLNGEKTKYVEFPYADKKDLTPIFDSVKDTLRIFNAFNLFVNMEKTDEQKGTIKYFISRISEYEEQNAELVLSIILNTIVNNPNSTIVAINKLVEKLKKCDGFSVDITNCLYKYLLLCVENGYDLEQVWIVYAIIKIDSNYNFSSDICSKLNELALTVILCEQNQLSKETILSIQRKCLILDYELWCRNLIQTSDFQSHGVDISIYQELKRKKFKFYRSKEKQE